MRRRRKGEGCWVRCLATLDPLISESLRTLKRGRPCLFVDLFVGRQKEGEGGGGLSRRNSRKGENARE